MPDGPWRLVDAAAVAVRERTGVEQHEVAVVLGSGWAAAADRVGETVAELTTADLPGFATPQVAGHADVVRSVRTADGRAVLVLLGRLHAYEGHELATVVHGVRVAARCGCRALVLTNAAGSLHDGLPPGRPVLISDHLNLTGRSPLTGDGASGSDRFVDLTDAYSARLRAIARDLDPSLVDGVYVGVAGPQYETPAEVRMLRQLGGDLVGMSTVHEVIAARHVGMEVLGISLVTNLGAGLGADGLDHGAVVDAGRDAAPALGDLLAAVVAAGLTVDGPLTDAEVVAQAQAWRDEDPDPVTRADLDSLLAGPDLPALRERFAARLQFGTAGLRGPLGAGPSRMNRALVRRATAGVAAWLRSTGADGPVVVARDARHGSAAFAEDAAAVLAGAGWDVRHVRDPVPTPVLAFAVRHLRAAAGIMITASHNPPADNGYKLYLGDGAQIVPPVDAEVSAAIDAVGPLASVPLTTDGVEEVGDELVDAYVDAALGLLRTGGPRSVVTVYTALHGVGARIVRRAFAAAGFPAPVEVAAQVEPDPDFPTVAFPNPEEPGALDLALAAAAEADADVVLANDPDADRLAVAVPLAGGGWRALSGDELGALVGDHVLRTTARRPGDLVVTTVVSSRLLARLAAAAGVGFTETLTGFKWVVRAARPGQHFLFGYEEALGYCVDDVVRDKDGIGAALVVAELVAGVRADGGSLLDRLDELHRRHGAHLTSARSRRVPGVDWLARVTAAMAGFRADPPAALAGRPVVAVEDLLESRRLPSSDVLIWTVDGGRVVVRPSGTEPKLKSYAEAVVAVTDDLAAARAEARALVDALLDDVDARFSSAGL